MPGPMLTFVQIQCCPVPNVVTTQCNVFMYGLTKSGEVWFKRDSDSEWIQEPMNARLQREQT